MDDLKKRLGNLENVISNLVSSLKKIEDVKKKDDLYSFTNQQLMKWLKDNQVNYNDSIKDSLVDIVWKNLKEWEWEYYYENEEESEEEPDEEPKEESDNFSENFSESSSDDDEESGKGKKKKMTSKN